MSIFSIINVILKGEVRVYCLFLSLYVDNINVACILGDNHIHLSPQRHINYVNKWRSRRLYTVDKKVEECQQISRLNTRVLSFVGNTESMKNEHITTVVLYSRFVPFVALVMYLKICLFHTLSYLDIKVRLKKTWCVFRTNVMKKFIVSFWTFRDKLDKSISPNVGER